MRRALGSQYVSVPTSLARAQELLAQSVVASQRLGEFGEVRTLAEVQANGKNYPIQVVQLGVESPSAPALVIVAGVHGLETIGVQIATAYMGSLAGRLAWDESMRWLLERARLFIIPVLNPGGMALTKRANPNGVDLMRNAPTMPWGAQSHPILGGQRISPRLPWFRGNPNRAMEIEAQALCDFVQREIFPADVSVVVDLHSGFGWTNRIWFPYGRTSHPFAQVAQVYALKELLDDAIPHHGYQIEPQSGSYQIVGDLWDYLYDLRTGVRPGGNFLPLTLELGSWKWVKKNPAQLLHRGGLFHPIKPHRVQRALRRHTPLLDFFLRIVASHERWTGLDIGRIDQMREQALALWYAPSDED